MSLDIHSTPTLLPAEAANSSVAPSSAQLENERRRADYLRVLNRAWLVLGFVSLLSAPLYTFWQVSIFITIAAATTFLAVEVLMRRRQLQIASVTFCVSVDAMFYVIFLLLIKFVGGVEAYHTQVPVLMLMGITALLAAALLGARAALMVAAINTIIVIGTRLLLAPHAEPRPGVLVFFWLVAGIAFLYENTLTGVFAELRGVRDGLESAVAQRTAELRKSIVQLQRVTQELSAANRDLDLFSGAVAHDLRNPLLVIEGYSRELQRDIDGLGADTTDALEKMLAAESRMHRLIDGLLAFARLGQHALRIEKVPMFVIADRLAAEYKGLEKDRALTITVDALPDCRGDPILIEQVLANLLANAVKFTRTQSNAEIRLRGQSANGELIYSVEDNGVGFEMDRADRLFSPLQRLHTQSEFEGTGIGLAAVDRMIRLHGGRVWAQSEPGKGATFFFALPLSNVSTASNDEQVDQVTPSSRANVARMNRVHFEL